MNNLNQWDVKQIIDIVSKGLNSILMSKPDIPPEELEKKARVLVKIYIDVLNELKNPPAQETLDFPINDEIE
jgi:hypothetical protein